MNTIARTLAIIFTIGSLTTIFAQPRTGKDNQTDSSSKATVYLFRSKEEGWLSPKYSVFGNGKLLCKLQKNHYCKIDLPVGETVFTTKWSGPRLNTGNIRTALSLKLESGKTYYLQGDIRLQSFATQAVMVLTEVVPNSYKLQQINSAKKVQAIAVVRNAN